MKPDFIQELLAWVTEFIRAHMVLTSGLMAFLMSLVRAKFTNKDETSLHNFSDAIICGFLTLSTMPVLGHIGLNEDFAIFIGSMIGFIGAEKIRVFLFDFVNSKIGGKNNNE